MFDVKFILVLIPLVVLLFLAYNEISDIKKNVKLLTTELKSQTTNISQNVSQCVERIEKISQSHISELQTINKMNLQQINRVNCIRMEGEDESEGLSSNYMSPNEKDIPVTHSRITREGTTTRDEGIHTKNDLPLKSKQLDDLYLSDDENKKTLPKNDEQVSEIPVYIPQGIPEPVDHNNTNEEDNDSESTGSVESAQDTSEFIDDILHPTDNIHITPEHIISLNNIEQIAGLVGMSEIFGGSQTNVSGGILHQNKLRGSGPIIEAISDEESNKQSNVENIDQNSEVSSHIDEIAESIKVPTPDKDVESIRSHTSKVSKKTESHDESQDEEKSSHSKSTAEEKSVLLSIDEYKLKDLQELAKKKGIATFTKVDGKIKQYRKQELYNVLLSKK